MPGVEQHNDQGPGHPPSPGVRVPHQSQTAKVQLGHFSGPGVGHAYRGLAPSLPVASPYEPSEGGVGDRAASLGQQFLDAGEKQLVASQPGMNLVLQGSRTAWVGILTWRGPARFSGTRPLSCSSVGGGPPWCRSACSAARMYLRTVVRDRPVDRAIARWLPPACQWRNTSLISTLDTS